MNQQKQTLVFFNDNAGDWQRKAAGDIFSVINNRHNAVLEVIKKQPASGFLLDVGCGTGQLAIEAGKLGWQAVGIDYAESMIEICWANNAAAGTQAEFQCASIFELDFQENFCDVISAQGFIEYISLEELDEFLALARRGLKLGGALALGSRNRLFNLHSLNGFSSLEFGLNATEQLLRESIAIQSSSGHADAISKLSQLNCDYRHPDTHPETGVKVDTRYQFSPGDLVARLKKHGLRATRLFPVHFHGLPLSVLGDGRLKQLHLELAELVSRDYITAHTFVPYSSSFLIEAVKD